MQTRNTGKPYDESSHLALLGAAHSFNHSLFVVAPPLLTMIMSDLNVSKSIIGVVATTASFIYGLGSVVGGPLADRISEVKVITASLALSGFSAFIMLVAGGTGSISIYALALILMSAWASLYHPTANSLISKAFKGRVSEAMGLHGMGGTIGVVLAPSIAWLIGVSFGWSWAFVAFGISCILLALLFAQGSTRVRLASFFLCFLTFSLFCYELVNLSPLSAAVFACSFAVCVIASFEMEARARPSLERHAQIKNRHSSILDALKIRELRILLAFNVAIGLFMKGVELFFPTYLTENRHFDPMWASIAYTLVLAAGVPAQLIGGKASDRFGSKRVLVATSLGVLASLLALLLIPAYVVGIVIFIVLYGLSFYAHQPALNSLAGLLSPESHRGVVYGIFFFTSFGVGSLSQLAAGYIADLYGLDAAFYLLAAFAVAALVLSFRLPEKKGKW